MLAVETTLSLEEDYDNNGLRLCKKNGSIAGDNTMARSDNDIIKGKALFQSTPLIYSEPALMNYGNEEEVRREGRIIGAASDPNLPCFFGNDSGISSLLGGVFSPGCESTESLCNFRNTSSHCFQDSKQSLSTARVTNGHPAPKQSYSTREIREQHAQVQKKYRHEKRRKFTDPVDFEGILSIIGGCTWWQVWVYLLISLQQIPHAMFSLSIVFMMYQPNHWCQVPGFIEVNEENTVHKWSLKDAMETAIIFPLIESAHRDKHLFYKQCCYYNRTFERYEQLRQMTLDEATAAVANESSKLINCQEWEYDTSVMEKTIVTQWNLVCSETFKRAYAHLLYSFGFLFGCLLGGFASDRFGRKPTVVGFGILSSMFGLFLPYSSRFSVFLLLRFLGGVCNEAADLAAYVLCIEVTGIRYRAIIGSLLQAPWAIGYILVTLVAYSSKSWQQVQLTTACVHIAVVLLVCVLPESPRWLIVNNRVEEAERYIRQACREPPLLFSIFKFSRPTLPCDLELVKHSERHNWVKRNQQANIFSILKSRVLCIRTVIVCFIWTATTLVYYGLVLVSADQSSGHGLFGGNLFVNNLVTAVCELSTLLGCIYLLRFGRRNSQMIALIGASTFMIVAVGAMLRKYHVATLVCLFFGKVFIHGSFNILYIFTIELYPTVIRNSVVGINSMITRFGSGVSSYIAILSNVTLSIVPLIIFSSTSILAALMTIFLPETCNKPLPDTLQDAVKFLQSNKNYNCWQFDFRKQKFSASIEGNEKDFESKENDVETGTETAIEEKFDHIPMLLKSSKKTNSTFDSFAVFYEKQKCFGWNRLIESKKF